jgi:hypothetical protein
MSDFGDFRGKKAKMTLRKNFRCVVHGWTRPARCMADGRVYCPKCHTRCPGCAAKKFFRFEHLW